ncbi:MAG: bifunctional demethylmenaquinone methyltransferase/2-methoxy-6-polyprenyl-1,4-benzoquinol methylase UbiE [Vampirovibrionales bacterium]|nr:bifunctional demethylmenaquinone methyltransferase/2-methoxy-6-polyprenyl-1,4-benzoquinol methylase UbiE [Vampirovibrionales bacterium]
MNTQSPSPQPVVLAAEPRQDKPQSIAAMFNAIAPRYDVLNDVISLGMHRHWKQKACRLLALKSGDRVLDVCTGTGDLAGILAGMVGEQGEVVGLDFSEDMLAVAQKRFASRFNLQWRQGDALNLPFQDATSDDNAADNAFDAAIISFGLRNVANIAKALSEMRRVVKPSGRVICLDTVPNPALPGFRWYFRNVMPQIGKWLSPSQAAYGYLNASTEGFLSPAELQKAFEKAGFSNVQTHFVGFGAAAITVGVC